MSIPCSTLDMTYLEVTFGIKQHRESRRAPPVPSAPRALAKVSRMGAISCFIEPRI